MCKYLTLSKPNACVMHYLNLLQRVNFNTYFSSSADAKCFPLILYLKIMTKILCGKVKKSYKRIVDMSSESLVIGLSIMPLVTGTEIPFCTPAELYKRRL